MCVHTLYAVRILVGVCSNNSSLLRVSYILSFDSRTIYLANLDVLHSHDPALGCERVRANIGAQPLSENVPTEARIVLAPPPVSSRNVSLPIGHTKLRLHRYQPIPFGTFRSLGLYKPRDVTGLLGLYESWAYMNSGFLQALG